MLIITHRHTKADLDLWREYEEIDKINRVYPERIGRSLGIISEWIETHPETAVYTSWGKDSVVLLHLLSLTKYKIPVVYMRFTDRDNPDCELVRDEFLKNHGIDYHEDFFEYQKVRKSGAHWKALQKKYGQYRITGIRNDESGIRKMIFLMYRESGLYSCRPLSLWKNHEVFAYVQQEGLPLSPVYGYLGGGRWPREHIRTHSLAGTSGNGIGRTEWEKEYYPDILSRINQRNNNFVRPIGQNGQIDTI